MKFNCRPGDLAIIVKEEPECEMNLGRIVVVHGPMKVVDGYQCWPIVPVNPEPLKVREGATHSLWSNVKLSDRIFHIDAWLKPIRPERKRVATVKSISLANDQRVEVKEHA